MLPNQWKIRNAHFLSLNTNNSTSRGAKLAARAGLVRRERKQDAHLFRVLLRLIGFPVTTVGGRIYFKCLVFRQVTGLSKKGHLHFIYSIT